MSIDEGDTKCCDAGDAIPCDAGDTISNDDGDMEVVPAVRGDEVLSTRRGEARGDDKCGLDGRWIVDAGSWALGDDVCEPLGGEIAPAFVLLSDVRTWMPERMLALGDDSSMDDGSIYAGFSFGWWSIRCVARGISHAVVRKSYGWCIKRLIVC